MSEAVSAPVPATGPKIVVGVDGSPASRDALHWAADYCRLSGGRLHAVTAWQWPVSMVVAMPIPDGFNPMEEARDALNAIIREDLGAEPGVPVSTEVECGSPATVLLHAAAGADMLVVGSRGHGGFTDLLLGSTSEHVVRHAPCPVLVVRSATSRMTR